MIMPQLEFYHKTDDCTGSAFSFRIRPAEEHFRGFLEIAAAQQKTEHPDTYDWAHGISVRLYPVEIAGMLRVLRGNAKSSHEEISTARITVRRRYAATRCEFCLQLKTEEDRQEVWNICLDEAETLALELAISGAMSNICFGI